MVVVVARRDESRLGAIARDQRETEHAAIERQRPFDIRDLEMDVADAGLRIDGRLENIGAAGVVRSGGFSGHDSIPVSETARLTWRASLDDLFLVRAGHARLSRRSLHASIRAAT